MRPGGRRDQSSGPAWSTPGAPWLWSARRARRPRRPGGRWLTPPYRPGGTRVARSARGDLGVGLARCEDGIKARGGRCGSGWQERQGQGGDGAGTGAAGAEEAVREGAVPAAGRVDEGPGVGAGRGRPDRGDLRG